MWRRFLLTLVLLITFAGNVASDSPAMPTSYAKPTGEFLFVMLADGGVPVLSSSGSPYPSSGLYRNDGSTTPIWTVGFYAFEGQVFLSPDGRHVAHLGPWPQRGNYGVLAVAFYQEGKLLTQYSVADLVKNPSALPESVSHYTWLKEMAQFDPESNLLTLVTHENRTYRFDLASGRVKGDEKPIVRGLSPAWWIGGTVAFVLTLWLINRKSAQ